MLKRCMAWIMAVALLAVGCSVPVSAAVDYRLYFDYEVLEDNTVRITAYKEPFTEEIKTLCIPSVIEGREVSEIGDSAFLRAFYLRTLIIPDTVKVIGRSAFQESGIEQFFLPEGLEEIHRNAFYWCQVKQLVIPSTVTVFEEQAMGYTCKSAYEENGEPIIPGVPGLDEDFVMYVQDNEAAVVYAEQNGVSYRQLTDMNKGDVDLDGVLMSADARAALLYLNAGFEGNWYTGDLNNDGVMNTADVRLMIIARIHE